MNEPITYGQLEEEALDKACDKLEDLDYELNMTEVFLIIVKMLMNRRSVS